MLVQNLIIFAKCISFFHFLCILQITNTFYDNLHLLRRYNDIKSALYTIVISHLLVIQQFEFINRKLEHNLVIKIKANGLSFQKSL